MSRAWVTDSKASRVVVTVIFVATFGGEPLLRAGAGKVDIASALAVSTDPVGAGVYLDGRYVGQTPLQVSAVAAGPHRVRVVKSGYSRTHD